MTKKTVLIKKSNTSIESTKNLELSIQFSLDGFSFCIEDSLKKRDIYFTEYSFNNSLSSPQELLDNVINIFKSDKNLQLNFNSVTVIHQNNLNTLVPLKYFDEELLKKYLEFNIKTLKTDFAAYDSLNNIKANNIYIPYVNINNYLFQHFGEFVYKHHLSVYIDKLLELNPQNNKEIVYVNVSKSSLDVVVLKNKELLLSNIFSFNNADDFLYYILFISEQLNLDTNKFDIYFSGEIEERSEIYKLSKKYIKNIHFLKSKNQIFKEFKEPNYSNFILLYK